MPDEEHIWAASIYGADRRKGLVELEVGKEKRVITPTEARAFAYSILEAAEAAETDEFLMGWLAERVGIKEDEPCVQVLRDFRKKREEMRKQ